MSQNLILYYDVYNGNTYNETGALYGNTPLTMYLNNKFTLEIHYMSDTSADAVSEWEPWTGLKGLSIGSSVAFDNDFLHAARGTLSSPVSSGDSNVIVNVAIAETMLNPSDVLVFYKPDGTTVSLMYSSYTKNSTGSGYVFNLTSPSNVSIDSGAYVRVPQALYLKADEDSISNENAQNGVFVINLHAMSHKILNALDYTNTQSLSGTFEHQIKNNGDIIRTFSFPFVIENLVDFNNAMNVPAQTGNWADKSYVASFFTAGETYQYSVDGVNWHDTLNKGVDIYYRSRINTQDSMWSEPRELLYGETASISVGEVTSGDTPHAEITGEAPNQKLNLVLPKGVKGDKGDANELSIGTVETGDAGTKASAEITGEAPNQVLNLVIPKGDRGSAFKVDASGLLADKGTYDAEVAGFSYLATDTGNVYIKNSATSGDWSDAIPFKGDKGDPGDKGDTGNGISKIEKTGTSGNVDTYTVTYTDGTTFSYTVTNGANGKDGNPGKDGVSPTVTMEKTDKGVVITIVDADGTESAMLRDGEVTGGHTVITSVSSDNLTPVLNTPVGVLTQNGNYYPVEKYMYNATDKTLDLTAILAYENITSVSGTWTIFYAVGEKGNPGAAVGTIKFPVGTIFASPVQAPISGTLICDGSAISRTDYAELFAFLGTTYGAGDGSTTFNIPDYRGKFLRGYLAGTSEYFGTAQGDAIRNITGYMSAYTDTGKGIFKDTSGAYTVPDANTDGISKLKTDGTYEGSSGRSLYFNASAVVPTANENRPVNYAVTWCITY